MDVLVDAHRLRLDDEVHLSLDMNRRGLVGAVYISFEGIEVTDRQKRDAALSLADFIEEESDSYETVVDELGPFTFVLDRDADVLEFARKARVHVLKYGVKIGSIKFKFQ